MQSAEVARPRRAQEVHLWSLLAALLALWISLVHFDGITHVQDELVYQLQARLLSEGRLWEESRLPLMAHHFSFITNLDGRRYGVFPNGWPAVLAIGTLLGVPWLVNPLLFALNVRLGSDLAGAMAGPGAARLAAPLLALAPAMILQAGSRMSHTLCALLSTSATLLLTRAPTPRRALAVGGLLALLLLTRPLDAITIGGVLGLWILLRREVRAWLWAVPPVLGGLALALLQNQIYEGDWRIFPQNAWFERGIMEFPDVVNRFQPGCNDLGFGEDRGCWYTFYSPGHTPEKALKIIRLTLELAGPLWFGAWPVALLALGALRKEGARQLLLLAAAAWAVTAGAYSLYWYDGLCLGPRFHHSAAPLVLAATAAGAAALSKQFRFSILIFYGLGLLQVARLLQALPELEDYWGVDDRMEALEEKWEGGPALMLVAYGKDYVRPVQLPLTTNEQVYIYSAVMRRSLWIERRDGPLFYAEYNPALVEATRAQYPDLPAYLLILTSDPGRDRIFALPEVDAPQVDDLPAPDPFPVDM